MTTPSEKISVGLLGLGAMGEPMARNLLSAGFPLAAFDVQPERLRAAQSAGALAVSEAAEVVRRSDFVLTSLPYSEVFVQVAETTLLPQARAGQVFIELGTTTPPEVRRLAAAFAERGAALVDAPVSGGPDGARQRALRMFVGGTPEAIERCRPILEALTAPELITLCGAPGMGQVVKGVNQLAMGLGAAAYLEALAFGARLGVPIETLRKAVGGAGGAGSWREHLGLLAGLILDGEGERISVKFHELPYFFREAHDRGQPLPLTEALHAFCDPAERVVLDNNRLAPSFWRELLRDRS